MGAEGGSRLIIVAFAIALCPAQLRIRAQRGIWTTYAQNASHLCHDRDGECFEKTHIIEEASAINAS